jgi:hypothetical protein
MPIRHIVTFQERFERVIENRQATIFPNRTVMESAGSGRPASRIVWHQFPTEEQIGQRLDEGMGERKSISLSACSEVDFAEAEFPRKLKRGHAPWLCEACAQLGELSEAEFEQEALEIIAEVHAQMDSKKFV